MEDTACVSAVAKGSAYCSGEVKDYVFALGEQATDLAELKEQHLCKRFHWQDLGQSVILEVAVDVLEIIPMRPIKGVPFQCTFDRRIRLFC